MMWGGCYPIGRHQDEHDPGNHPRVEPPRRARTTRGPDVATARDIVPIADAHAPSVTEPVDIRPSGRHYESADAVVPSPAGVVVIPSWCCPWPLTSCYGHAAQSCGKMNEADQPRVRLIAYQGCLAPPMEGRLVVIIASGRRGDKSRAQTKHLREWTVWALPRQALGLLLVVEGLAATLTVIELVHAHPGGTGLARFVLLAILSVVHGELEDRTDRIRRSRAVDAPYVDATSVWTFAAVLVLPAGYAALLVVLIYTHTIVRVRRNGSGHPHRSVFSGAAVVLSVLAARSADSALSQVGHIPTGAAQVVGVIGAVVVYRLVNDGAIAAVLYLTTRPASMADALLQTDDLAVEIATLPDLVRGYEELKVARVAEFRERLAEATALVRER